MQKIAAPLFTLVAPAGWPFVALRCNDPNLSSEAAHEVVCAAMKASEPHNIVEHIDECTQGKTLYIILTMHSSTEDNEDARAMALGVVATIVAETRQYLDAGKVLVTN